MLTAGFPSASGVRIPARLLLQPILPARSGGGKVVGRPGRPRVTRGTGRARRMGRSERRRLPVGAEVLAGGGVQFRVWAPRHDRVEVVWRMPGGRGGDGESPARTAPLDPEGGGYFSGTVPGASAGVDYRYRLGGGEPVP